MENEGKTTHKEQLPLTQLTVTKGLKKHGQLAEDAVAAEFIQLFKTKKALVHVIKEYIEGKHLLK